MFAAIPVAFLAPGAGGGGGGGGSVTVTALPSSQVEGGFGSNWTFGSVGVTVTGGSPSAYSWAFRNEAGGFWQIAAGQGTATATPSVSFIPAGGSVSAEFVCSVTVSGVVYQASCFLQYDNYL